MHGSDGSTLSGTGAKGFIGRMPFLRQTKHIRVCKALITQPVKAGSHSSSHREQRAGLAQVADYHWTVTHPVTGRARCCLTLLIETNAVPQHHATTNKKAKHLFTYIKQTINLIEQNELNLCSANLGYVNREKWEGTAH